ncbi:MAG: DUF2752 domain-containing protein [Acidimicrobiia bacterium]
MQQLTVDTRPLRWAGAAALVAAASLPLLPGHDTVTCPLRATTGVPCPLCGMTRGVGAVVRGDLAHAIALNPGSLLLVAVVIGVFFARRRPTVRMPAWVPITVLAAMWAFQLFKYATGRPL